jgi:hypothetical protein
MITVIYNWFWFKGPDSLISIQKSVAVPTQNTGYRKPNYPANLSIVSCLSRVSNSFATCDQVYGIKNNILFVIWIVILNTFVDINKLKRTI